MPVNPILNSFINGDSLRQFQFQLLSCNYYGADVMQNMSNSKYYEDLYKLIEKFNRERNLPDIEGIKTIECLNNGGILDASTNTARYSIQMRVTYYENQRGVNK